MTPDRSMKRRQARSTQLGVSDSCRQSIWSPTLVFQVLIVNVRFMRTQMTAQQS